MSKFYFVILIFFCFNIFSAEDISKDFDRNTSLEIYDSLESNELLSKEYFQPIEIDQKIKNDKHKELYLKTGVIFGFNSKDPICASLGVGYKKRKNIHGHDFSFNVMALPFFEYDYFLPIPYFKYSFLLYPFYKKNVHLYLGFGCLNFAYIPVPFATIGYDLGQNKKVNFSIQLESIIIVNSLSFSLGF